MLVPELRTTNRGGFTHRIWTVRDDADGSRWWPDAEASIEISRDDDPVECLMGMVLYAEHRGSWYDE